MKEYIITKEQLDGIKSIMDKIAYVNDSISELCANEHSDINYGFELGKIYSTISSSRVEMLMLDDEIRNQEHNK